MMGRILWKEWRENRWKYASLWLAYNAPVLALGLFLGLNPGARAPFADLTDRTVMKYLPLALGEGLLIVGLFLLATTLAAVACYRAEMARNTVFFVFEQPISRRRYAAFKLFCGAGHAALAAGFAVLLAPTLCYAMMLASGNVSIAGSGAAFAAVFGAALRAVPWCALVTAAAFSGAALIAAVLPRWWLAALAAMAFAVALGSLVLGDNPWFGGAAYFDIVPTSPDQTMSVSVSFPAAQWLVVSHVLSISPSFAPWQWTPPLVALLAIGLFFTGLAAVYQRKELK